MLVSRERLSILEVLVEELIKDVPQEHIVQKCMLEVGIPDSRDPIDRINKVLMALHFEEHDKEIKE